MTWEEIIIQIRKQPEYADLVEKAYFDEDLALNVQRFKASEEYQETLNLIREFAPKASSLADIGSGNGISAVAFALDGFIVTAVEPDPSQTVGSGAIRQLKQKFELDQLNVVDTVGENLPFSDNSFDLVYIRQAMHHAQDLNRFLAEASRVLKPGGILLTIRDHVVFNENDKQWFLESHPLHKFYGGENAFSPAEYEQGMSKAGLKIIKKLRFFDSPINYFPMAKEAVEDHFSVARNNLVKALSARLPGFIASSSMVIWIYCLLRNVKLERRPDEQTFPGRMYSYIARKSS